MTRAALLPRLFRAAEAAQYLGMGVTKFRELVAQGRIAQPSEEDGLVRWDRTDLDEYADGLRQRPEPVQPPREVRAI
jgi:excisionase family DNA binding protein